MAKVTNYAAGMRGLTLRQSKDGEGTITTWVAPGETAEYDPALLVGELPDMGTKPSDPKDDAAKDVQIAELTAQNEQLQATIADLNKQLADATAPKK